MINLYTHSCIVGSLAHGLRTLIVEAKVVVSLNIDDFTSGLQASCSVTVFMASAYISCVF